MIFYFFNSCLIKFIDKIIENRRTEHNNRVFGVSQSSELTVSQIFVPLPFVPVLRDIFKRISRKHNINTCFQSVRPIVSLLNSRKDLTLGKLANVGV